MIDQSTQSKTSQREKKQDFELPNSAIKIVLVVLSLVLIITIIYFIDKGNLKFWEDPDLEMLSTFGTFLSGLIGTGLTVIATFLIWMTYNSQKRELKETKEIAEGQRQAMLLQNETAKKQQFETTFFNMLNKLDQIFRYTKGNYNSLGTPNWTQMSKEELLVELSGIQYFKRANDLFSNYIRFIDSQLKSDKVNYTLLMQSSIYSIGHFLLTPIERYYSYLLTILDFIEDSNLNSKFLYFDLIKSQLTQEELKLIIYKTISNYPDDTFKKYITKFNLLVNLNAFEQKLGSLDLSFFFPYSAFNKMVVKEKIKIILKAIEDNPVEISEDKIVDHYCKIYKTTGVTRQMIEIELIKNDKNYQFI